MANGNKFVRIWRGFWRGITALRHGALNVLFVLVLLAVVIVLIRGGQEFEIQNGTTLVINPVGALVEEGSGSPIERALMESLGSSSGQVQLRDLLAALEHAAEDDRISQVLINADRMAGLAPGMMIELSQAMDAFRESGKPVIAYGSDMGMGQYFLASLADELWLDPDGFIFLEGYSSFRNYFAEGLDKLEVDVNLLRVGEFKSAMEPFTQSSMSDEDREATEYFLSDLWGRYLASIAANRGMPVEVMSDFVMRQGEHLQAANGDPAQMVLDHGLVDRLISRPEARAELAQRGAADEQGGFEQVGFLEYAKAMNSAPSMSGDQIGIIVASGGITEGDQPAGSIGSESTSRLIRQAANDDRIKAVVLRVDSGGGSAFASEVIRRELMALKEAGKPVVVSMGNVAASGGYWIAMGADEVWAYPSTITGSIGIFGFFPTFQNSLARLGIYTDGVSTTPYGGALRPDRAMSDEVESYLQAFIENGYRQFLGLVSNYRGLTFEQVDEVAQGRVWTGAQAQQRGLVDQLGTLTDAVDAAARIAGLGESYSVVYVQPELKPWQQFLTQMAAQALVASGLDLQSSVFAQHAAIGRLPIINDLRKVLEASTRTNPGVMAHCLCEAPLQ